MYQSNKEESKNIRELFKTDKSLSRYKLVQNGHGTGTAYGWIHVTVTYPDGEYTENSYNYQRHDERMRIYFLIKNIVGRGDRQDDSQSDYFCENILLDFISESSWKEKNSWKERRKQNRIKHQTCPNCGTIVKEFRRWGYHFVRCCPKCETQWEHGSA